MSDTHTRLKIDRMKLTPEVRALASASQASHRPMRPSAQRTPCGSKPQPAGPAFSAQEPPSTHTAIAAHHADGGALCSQPAPSASAQAAPSSRPNPIDDSAWPPLRRTHSQPAAAMKIKVSAANGSGTGANNAGRTMPSRTTAVMTRCLSIVSAPAGVRPRSLPRWHRTGDRVGRNPPGPHRARLRRIRATGNRKSTTPSTPPARAGNC